MVEAVITARDRYTGEKASYSLTAYPETSNDIILSVNKESLPYDNKVSIKAADYRTDTIPVNIENQDDYTDIVYSSDNENIAAIDTDGSIHILEVGTAHISVTAAKKDEWKKYEKTFTIESKAVDSYIKVYVDGIEKDITETIEISEDDIQNEVVILPISLKMYNENGKETHKPHYYVKTDLQDDNVTVSGSDIIISKTDEIERNVNHTIEIEGSDWGLNKSKVTLSFIINGKEIDNSSIYSVRYIENGKVTKHTFSLDGYDHLSEAVPVPGTGRITMIHAVSGKGRMEECLLELDMDTGRCRIAPLPGMGEGLKLRWFTGDWLLVQGNGEILSDDFAQLINRNTCEVLRIRPGMFGGEKMQHIGILTDGTVVIVTRRDRVGPVFRYPIDFWGFLRTANKPKKLEWREYKEVYPNLPIFLPPKATERKIILKKDSLTILGSVFTPPFTLSQLAEKLGPAHIVLQNGTRKSPMTGRESPYTQALALWDELGLQGWLDEDEQTIKAIGVRVAAQGEYAVRQTFDGAVWIGSKDYREASWKDFAGFAHTLKLGGFTVYTRLPGPVSEEQSAQKAKLEALSAMVQISWKEPEQKAAKAQKYKLSKPTEPVLTFTSFNFKLAVMEVLMYEKGLLAPKLDAHEFAREYSRRKIDIDTEGYEPIPEIRKWLEKYPVPERLAPEVTEIEMDGGSEIYTQLCPFWDGEDGAFDLNTVTEAELRQFPNLKHITLMSSKPEQVLPVLERCSIKVDLL
mgnify:CR=1 FL=1